MMKRGLFLCLYTFLLVAFCSQTATAQTPPISLRAKMATISAHNDRHMPEKLYIHTDKWNYNREDTLWFKAYVFDATMASTSKSGLMYIEIANAQNRVVNRNMVKLEDGTGWGYIALPESRYPEGTYTLRAYTNWQRNFDEQYMYTRQFAIEGAIDENWMINSRFELTDKGGRSNVKTSLAFIKNNGSRMFAEELRVRVTDGDNLLHYYKITTGADGTADFDFNLGDRRNSGKLNLTIIKKTKDGKDVTFNVPVIINRDEKIDLQFMPEGGNLVAGLPCRVGFKAINEEGKGVDLTGAIYNNANQKVADIGTSHKGMGTFEFTPQANQNYTAKINHKGKELSYTLPKVSTSGVTMKIDNISNKDSVIVYLTPTADLKREGVSYYLIAQARNVVCYGAAVNMSKPSLRFTAPISAFPTGVARFTLLSQTNQPVAERIVYINHNDQIRINIQASKPGYGTRDSVTLEIIATDNEGFPIAGNFSLAVTDDAQALPDTTADNDMPARLLIADDLKGYVENAGWYFAKGDTIKKVIALDILMLTQGWVKYNWQDVFAEKQKQLAFLAEPELTVKGKAVNVFKQPLKKSSILLLGFNPTTVAETQTNDVGEFEFTGLSYPDTARYHIQAKNKNGKAFNVSVEVEEFKPPVFALNPQRVIPLYVNIDTTRLAAILIRQLYNEEEFASAGNRLKEVEIKAKKIVKGSKALVDDPEFILNEEDFKEMGKATFGDMLKRIPGFKIDLRGGLRIGDKRVLLVVDGMISYGVFSAGFTIKDLLAYRGTDDVKGIEVITASKHLIKYFDRYFHSSPKVLSDYAFLDITTYSGIGFSRPIPGSYVFYPPVVAANKEFYSPKYNVKKTAPEPDTRATIFWQPNVITDSDGKASVSFYTADKAGTYTVQMQGTDMGGVIGAHQSKISVKQEL